MQNAVLNSQGLPERLLTEVHPPPWLFEVGPPFSPQSPLRSYTAQVRGFEVELYNRASRKMRGGSVSAVSLRLIDVGQWRQGSYVRWSLERHFSDFNILDELDEKLRLHFPPGVGVVHRADLPVSIPSVRLSSVR